MLLNQPLAAIHAATDEEHLSHTAAHAALLAEAAHDDAGHRHDGSSHPDSLHHQTCQVCPLVGTALAPLGSAKAANTSDRHHATGPVAIQATKTEKRLRVGDPVRAPPAAHLI